MQSSSGLVNDLPQPLWTHFSDIFKHLDSDLPRPNLLRVLPDFDSSNKAVCWQKDAG